MRQYSIDKVELAWAGLDFKEGLAAGDVDHGSANLARVDDEDTGMGRVVRVFNPSRSGTVAIVVDQESKLHQQLRAIAIADALTRNQVFPMLLTDTSTGEVFAYGNAFIMTEPDETRGTESATFTWTFGVEVIAKVPAPNDLNIVGQ